MNLGSIWNPWNPGGLVSRFDGISYYASQTFCETKPAAHLQWYLSVAFSSVSRLVLDRVFTTSTVVWPTVRVTDWPMNPRFSALSYWILV